MKTYVVCCFHRLILGLYFPQQTQHQFHDVPSVSQRPDILQWPREFAKGIPLQANGYDCGVYTLLFAEYSVSFLCYNNRYKNRGIHVCIQHTHVQAKGDAFDFDQENIDDFRVRFVRDIMRLKID